MKKITVKDSIEMQKYKDPMEQQIFLISRYFDISMEDIKNCSMPVYQKMSEEVMAYLNRELDDGSDYLQYVEKQKHIEKQKQYSDKEQITINRSELMDFD